MRGLKNRVAVVTGGAGGIGASICRRLSEEGTRVAILDLNLVGARALSDELSQRGVPSQAYEVDITNYAQVEAAISEIESSLGSVDVLVNNAGWDHAARFTDTSPELWQKIIAINLVGPLNLQHTVVRRMLARSFGRIVNIASDAGRVGSSGESVYSACKGGVIAF